MDPIRAPRVRRRNAYIGLIVAAAYWLMQRERSRRSVWVREWIRRREEGRGILNMLHMELASEDTQAFRNFLRMREDQFLELLGLLREDIGRQETLMRASISAEKRLALTLRFLATGESYRSLMYSTRIHETTIGRIIPEVCRSIYRLLKGEFMKTPRSRQEWEGISAQFLSRWNFPMCLGAIDGKHIAFRPPTRSGSYYFNYKGGHSIVLMAVVDADYKFIYVDVGVNGRISDGGVFRNCSLATAMGNNSLDFPANATLPNSDVEVPYVFVADDAFPLTPRIMKPYPSRNLTGDKVNFNYRLSRARRVVENAFGILSNRFRVFLSTINLSPETVEEIVLASVVLHNYLTVKNRRDFVPEAEEEECQLLAMPPQAGNRPTAAAMTIRDKFNMYLNEN